MLGRWAASATSHSTLTRSQRLPAVVTALQLNFPALCKPGRAQSHSDQTGMQALLAGQAAPVAALAARQSIKQSAGAWDNAAPVQLHLLQG